jgi:hypothetical protein
MIPPLRPLVRLTALATLAALAACGASSTPEEEADDPRILAQALGMLQVGGRQTFWVAAPETRFVLDDDGEDRLRAIADKVRDATGIAGYDARPLLDRLLERNRRPGPLPVTSWPGAPFQVDHSGTYEKYTASGNEGDWKRMYADFPEVAGVARAGLPAYDREHGIALVYLQALKLPGSGNGSIYVLGWDGAAAEELGRVVVWSP